MKITEDIYRVDDVFSNVYAYRRRGNVIIIDTGVPGQAEKIASYVDAEVAGTISHIIITHTDGDHMGSVSGLKEIIGAEVAVHEEEAEILAGRQPPFKGRREGWEPVEPDLILTDGQEVAGLRVVHTPGHTLGHICLYSQERRALFAGDSMVTDEDKVLGPNEKFTLDMETARKSLRRLTDLSIEVICPGHGPPVVGKAGDRLQAYLED